MSATVTLVAESSKPTVFDRALQFHRSGNRAKAAEGYRKHLRQTPNDPVALYLLGTLEYESRRLESAVDLLLEAVALAPEEAEYHDALGTALAGLGKLDDAASAYRRALRIDPHFARAWFSLGRTEESRLEFVPAAGHFKKAWDLSPDRLEACHNRARALYEIGQVTEACRHFGQSAASDSPLGPMSRAMLATIIPGDPAADNQSILETRRRFAERDLPPAQPARAPRKPRGTPIRLGYVSSFFHRDNWMKPVWGLLNQHDRSRFQVNLFSDSPSLSQGYRPHPSDRLFETSRHSNESLAELIRKAEIDLLIDLNGYSRTGRLPLYQLRPASAIIGWFNMYATSGMPGFDYLIGDASVIPASEEPFYTEKILRVSGSYLTFSIDYPVPPVSDLPCLTTPGITFGSLASQYKITPQVVALWSRILLAVPKSSLLLKNKHLASPTTRQFMQDQFAKHDIAPERLFFEGPEDHFEFLKAYDRIDIALDPFPYNGGTTTTEAIWQGVPVVTFNGDRWASRTSTSILNAANSQEFVAIDQEAYAAIAVRWANAPEDLRNLRSGMRGRLAQSPVCDTATFSREMERLYLSCLDI